MLMYQSALACKALGLNRSSIRYDRIKSKDEARLRDDIIRFATQYGRYGYLRITAMLKAEGFKSQS
jgi:hypothetical protein